MSVKGKKAGLVISWQKSFSILAPWRKGKGGRDALLDSEVVLTKIKLFSNFHKRLLMADDSVSTNSTISVSEQDISDPTKASKMNSHLDDKSQIEPSSDYLSGIFSDSQRTRLYKFESEDSGVEFPSGANSPSTPTGSEQSFVVHSRESSCDSCNLNSDPATVPDKLVTEDLVDNSLSIAVDTLDNMFIHSDDLSSSAMRIGPHISKDEDGDQCRASGIRTERDEEMSEQFEENSTVTEGTYVEDVRPAKPSSTGACDDMRGNDFKPEPIWKSVISDGLEKYMDECCRLSEAQKASSNPLGSGLGYLEHLCQLIEKIGELQETNLRLQRQIYSLHKDDMMVKTKEDFFQQCCRCGAASLAFQDVQKIHSRSEILSPSGTFSDLSTICEVARHPLISTRRAMSNDGLAAVPLLRGLDQMSYTEREVHYLGDSTEGLSIPQRTFSENYTWSGVKDLVRRTKLKNQSRVELNSTSLRMSCPQLYMFDQELLEPAGRNKNSRNAFGQRSGISLCKNKHPDQIQMVSCS